MNNYCEIIIPVQDEALREVIIARLAEIEYEGFEETDANLKAYISEAEFSESKLNVLLDTYPITYSQSIINKQNWNQLWESNFEPVRVENFVGIRAFFHPPFDNFDNVEHEIVITPKMSFGTGHHATTYMVMQLMRGLDFGMKSVFDFGTGTGILAILAERLGATKVLAVDNDDWCIDNASENILINSCKYVEIQKIDSLKLNQQFNIILANINRNIILDNIHELQTGLLAGGQLLLSGLLKEDETEIRTACINLGLEYKTTLDRNGWIALWFVKN